MPTEPRARHGRVVRRDDFHPCGWLPGPHLPTLWASLWRRVPALQLEFEQVELPDGDFLELAWSPPRTGPLVVVLHGLEGSHRSRYARAVLALLDSAGMRGVLMQFRGCGATANRLARSYHSGDTGDLCWLVHQLGRRHGAAPFAVVGYSVGGNVVLKWLGELGHDAPVRAAVAISVPFDLGACAERLEQGFSRTYRRHLVGSLRHKYRDKFARRCDGPVAPAALERHVTFRAWDEAVTAPLHGFRNADDYYARASCRPFLRDIRVPTLVLHAEDDPFVPREAIPAASELGPTVTLELTRGGGHVGFIGGASPWRHGYWCEPRVVAYLLARVRQLPGYNAAP